MAVSDRKRRRLGDLFVVGEMLTIDDDTGLDPVQVYIRKLTPIEQERALKAANGVRAGVTASLKDQTSDDFISAWGEIEMLSLEDVRTALVEEDIASDALKVEEQVAQSEEWQGDNYLEGLIEAWNDGASETYYMGEPEEDADESAKEAYADAVRIFDEMERANKQIASEIDALREQAKKDILSESETSMRERLFEARKQAVINTAWFSEYRRQELFYATREPDTKKLYFENRKEVDELPLEVLARLVSVYNGLNVNAMEGKE